MAKRQSRRSSLKKGRPPANQRNRKQRCLIVSGGEVTEAQYFELLQDRYQHLVLSVKSEVGSPDQVADYAAKLVAGSNSLKDEDGYAAVFVVVDVDDFLVDQFKRAEGKCGSIKAMLAISNPCFEVWLIDYRQPCPDSFTATKACEDKAKSLGLVRGSRGKSLSVAFAQNVVHTLPDAVANAERHNTYGRRQERERLDSLSFAPWTDMPQLIKALDRLNLDQPGDNLTL